MEYRMENEKLAVTVSDAGAELRSIYDKEPGRELLWQGDPRYWKDRAPNIFPYVARLTEGRYTYHGESYSMRIHGFVKYMRLEGRAEKDQLVFELRDSEATRREYPFSFIYRVIYRLEGKALAVSYEVKNTDTKAMYFGLGGHPGFQVPFIDGTKFTDYYVKFESGASPEKILFSEDCFVTGKEPFSGLQDQKLALKHSLFDEDAIVLKNPGNSVILGCTGSSAAVRVDFPEMDYLGLWHRPKSDAPYLCIEPWSSLPSRKGIVEDLEKQEDLIALPAGEKYINTFCITII